MLTSPQEEDMLQSTPLVTSFASVVLIATVVPVTSSRAFV